MPRDCLDVRLMQFVTLYRGGMYQLYTYKRYQPLKLVMAPERSDLPLELNENAIIEAGIVSGGSRGSSLGKATNSRSSQMCSVSTSPVA